jgi:hypothetical protein
MPMSEAQKRATKKWRDNHREKFNAYMLPLATKYYENNKELVLEKKKQYYEDNKSAVREKTLARYYLKKEIQIFMNILIDY